MTIDIVASRISIRYPANAGPDSGEPGERVLVLGRFALGAGVARVAVGGTTIAQSDRMMVSWIRVTAPAWFACPPASSRPSTVTLALSEMSSWARIVPR